MQPDLLTWMPPEPKGETYVPELDSERLGKQCKRALMAFLTGRRFTLRELEDETGDPQASLSARYRQLKDEGFPMRKERQENGKFVYWMEIDKIPPGVISKGEAAA